MDSLIKVEPSAKSNTMFKRYRFIALSALVLSLGNGFAVTIHWGNAVGDFIYQSDGTTPVSNSFSFELGTFSNGFVPELNNADDWASNWHVLDQGNYSPVTGRLAGSVTLLDNPMPDGAILDGNATDTASFFFGKDAYLWVYNQNATVDSTLEWSLISNPTGGGDAESAWTFPVAGADARTVADFALSDPGVSAGFGAESGGGTLTSGEGDSSGTPATFGIQTYTIPAIPEPSSALLVLLALCGLGGRRKR